MAETPDLTTYRLSHLGIEAALRAFDLSNDSPFLGTLQSAGYNYRQPQTTYPYPQYIAILRAILGRGLPQMNEADATLEWGRRQYDAIGQTILGRVVMASFRVVGFERALGLSVRAMNNDAPFGERTFSRVSPGHCRINFADDPGGQDNGFMLRCVVGAYQRMCAVFRAANPRVEATITGPMDFTIDVWWDV